MREDRGVLKAGDDLAQSIAEHPFFTGLRPEHVAEVVRNAREAIFQAGDILLGEHAPANCFFVIKEGEVALESRVPGGRSILIETMGPRDVLGWSWLVAPYIWQFSARALKPTKVIVINGAPLLALCESNPAFGYDFLKRIMRIILARLQSTRRRLVEAQRQ